MNTNQDFGKNSQDSADVSEYDTQTSSCQVQNYQPWFNEQLHGLQSTQLSYQGDNQQQQLNQNQVSPEKNGQHQNEGSNFLEKKQVNQSQVESENLAGQTSVGESTKTYFQGELEEEFKEDFKEELKKGIKKELEKGLEQVEKKKQCIKTQIRLINSNISKDSSFSENHSENIEFLAFTKQDDQLLRYQQSQGISFLFWLLYVYCQCWLLSFGYDLGVASINNQYCSAQPAVFRHCLVTYDGSWFNYLIVTYYVSFFLSKDYAVQYVWKSEIAYQQLSESATVKVCLIYLTIAGYILVNASYRKKFLDFLVKLDLGIVLMQCVEWLIMFPASLPVLLCQALIDNWTKVYTKITLTRQKIKINQVQNFKRFFKKSSKTVHFKKTYDVKKQRPKNKDASTVHDLQLLDFSDEQ